MVKYNLTESQKDLLTELVALVKSGKIDEEFQILWHGNEATGFRAMLLSSNKPGKDFPVATKSGITALEKNGLLFCQGNSSRP